MSKWTYIKGFIEVAPIGRTQPEKRYILDTVLDHLPKVTGSERDMHVHVVQAWGYNGFSSHNEFDEWHGPYSNVETQDYYYIIVEGQFRDRVFDETFREFIKWVCRLAKRVNVTDILVKLYSYDREYIFADPRPYEEMFELPSWFDKSNREPTWAEYLMWESAKDSCYPMKLAYKYHNDPGNDAEMERRDRYLKGEDA